MVFFLRVVFFSSGAIGASTAGALGAGMVATALGAGATALAGLGDLANLLKRLTLGLAIINFLLFYDPEICTSEPWILTLNFTVCPFSSVPCKYK